MVQIGDQGSSKGGVSGCHISRINLCVGGITRVQTKLADTVYCLYYCDYSCLAVCLCVDVCVCERGRGERPGARTLILRDKDWRGPGSDVTTPTPESQLNECRRTLMNRHTEESNEGLISPWNPLTATFFSFVSPYQLQAVRYVGSHPDRPSVTNAH